MDDRDARDIGKGSHNGGGEATEGGEGEKR